MTKAELEAEIRSNTTVSDSIEELRAALEDRDDYIAVLESKLLKAYDELLPRLLAEK